MRVVAVAAACSTPVKTFAAHMCCVLLHFLRSTGNSPRVTLPGNSVVGTHCKVASTSLCGTLCIFCAFFAKAGVGKNMVSSRSITNMQNGGLGRIPKTRASLHLLKAILFHCTSRWALQSQIPVFYQGILMFHCSCFIITICRLTISITSIPLIIITCPPLHHPVVPGSRQAIICMKTAPARLYSVLRYTRR
jgi:hypothetical protein